MKKHNAPTKTAKQEINFSHAMREAILARDSHKCVVCGQGKRDGMELHVAHIMPIDLGGKTTMVNGQTLCTRHNMQKKTMSQTEMGEKMFIKLLACAEKEGDEGLRDFCVEVLSLYDKHGINRYTE